MLSNIWDVVLYKPLLNALAFLVSVIPGGDVGVAVIILTILVKVALFPLSHKSIKSQAVMSMLAPELEKIKKGGTSKEEQARLLLSFIKNAKRILFLAVSWFLYRFPLFLPYIMFFLKV